MTTKPSPENGFLMGIMLEQLDEHTFLLQYGVRKDEVRAHLCLIESLLEAYDANPIQPTLQELEKEFHWIGLVAGGAAFLKELHESSHLYS